MGIMSYIVAVRIGIREGVGGKPVWVAILVKVVIIDVVVVVVEVVSTIMSVYTKTESCHANSSQYDHAAQDGDHHESNHLEGRKDYC